MKTRKINELTKDQKINNERRMTMKNSIKMLVIVCALASMLLGGLPTSASADISLDMRSVPNCPVLYLFIALLRLLSGLF